MSIVLFSSILENIGEDIKKKYVIQVDSLLLIISHVTVETYLHRFSELCFRTGRAGSEKN